MTYEEAIKHFKPLQTGMTYEEAIKHFKSLQKRYTTEHNGKMCEKVALALEAMEKQVPAAPYKVGIDEYECPIKTCRGKLTKGYPCKCGKIIDWSNVDKEHGEYK